MGYIFIIFALAEGAVKGFCGKKISGLVSTIKGTFYMNTLRMLICTVIGFSANNIFEVENARVEIYVGSNPNLPIKAEIFTQEERLS